ncbi:MAG: Ig-like domain-containing protein, partial [Nitrososphaerales archaeon]
ATVAVGASGQPLSGAAVVWQTNGGTLVGVQNSTNSAGKANTTLQGTTIPATIRVSAQISAPGYETVNVNSTIQVYNPTPPPQPPNSNSVFGIPFLGMPILGIPLWAIIVIAAGGAGGGFFYMKRIRGAAFQYQDEE